ncbi:MAG: hypothetical protein NWE89_03725 [Candidatus Bathyarchaeota archaeon]|nr:hypothetical protein [Candidatus Bathyarchaeota archaeon]
MGRKKQVIDPYLKMTTLDRWCEVKENPLVKNTSFDEAVRKIRERIGQTEGVNLE